MRATGILLLAAFWVSPTVGCLTRLHYETITNIKDYIKPEDMVDFTPSFTQNLVWDGYLQSSGFHEVGEGEDATLECDIKTKTSDHIVVWYHENVTVALLLQKGNNTWETFTKNCNCEATVKEDRFYLNIKNASESSAGNYSCQVQRNGFPVAQDSVNLAYLTTQWAPTQQVEAHRMDHVELTCGVNFTGKTYEIKWLDDKSIEIPDPFQSRKGLRIIDARLFNSGVYTCKVSGSGFRGAQSIKLRVLPMPRNLVEIVTVRNGENATLVCPLNMTAENCLGTVYWYSQKRLLGMHLVWKTSSEPSTLFPSDVKRFKVGWLGNNWMLWIFNATSGLAGEYYCAIICHSKSAYRQFIQLHVLLENGTVVQPGEDPDYSGLSGYYF